MKEDEVISKYYLPHEDDHLVIEKFQCMAMNISAFVREKDPNNSEYVIIKTI